MPELPEVETVRRGLEPAMLGARLIAIEQRRPDLRFPFPERFAERLTGRRVEGLRRRAKYLIADLDGAELLVMHLGMSGSFRIEQSGGAGHRPPAFEAAPKNSAHDHVAFDLSTGARIVYNDPRRFGFMQLDSRGRTSPAIRSSRISESSHSAASLMAPPWPSFSLARKRR